MPDRVGKSERKVGNRVYVRRGGYSVGVRDHVLVADDRSVDSGLAAKEEDSAERLIPAR